MVSIVIVSTAMVSIAIVSIAIVSIAIVTCVRTTHDPLLLPTCGDADGV